MSSSVETRVATLTRTSSLPVDVRMPSASVAESAQPQLHGSPATGTGTSAPPSNGITESRMAYSSARLRSLEMTTCRPSGAMANPRGDEPVTSCRAPVNFPRSASLNGRLCRLYSSVPSSSTSLLPSCVTLKAVKAPVYIVSGTVERRPLAVSNDSRASVKSVPASQGKPHRIISHGIVVNPWRHLPRDFPPRAVNHAEFRPGRMVEVDNQPPRSGDIQDVVDSAGQGGHMDAVTRQAVESRRRTPATPCRVWGRGRAPASRRRRKIPPNIGKAAGVDHQAQK